MVRLLSRRERDLAQMRSPSPTTWPIYPFLPLRRDQADEDPELGFLYDAEGTSGQPHHHQKTVFLLNLCDIGDSVQSEQTLFRQQHIQYDSFTAILDDGWHVD